MRKCKIHEYYVRTRDDCQGEHRDQGDPNWREYCCRVMPCSIQYHAGDHKVISNKAEIAIRECRCRKNGFVDVDLSFS